MFDPASVFKRLQFTYKADPLAAKLRSELDRALKHSSTLEAPNAVGAAIGEEISQCGFAAPNTAITRANAVSVPARMSIGSVASQMASMRITGQAHGQSVRILQDRKLAISQ